MNRSRPVRSKTGCSSCRRRKVRCDEAKPICNACTRLGLTCSYEPTRTANSAETLRYRVRFVSSRYTRSEPEPEPEPDETRSNPSQSRALLPGSPPQSATSVTSETERNSELPISKSKDVELSSNEQQSKIVSNNSTSTATMSHSHPHPHPHPHPHLPSHPAHPAHSSPLPLPAQILTGHSPQPSTSPAVIPDPSAFALTSQMHVYEPQIPGYVPAFFDPNMNFDLLGEDWLSPHTPGDASQDSESIRNDFPESSSCSTQEASVIIGPDDHKLIQHYLNVMTGYAKIRCSGDENIYSHIFSNMALFYAPLYDALMAWTALHLGQARSDPDLIRKAEERYAHAVSLTHQDQNVAVHFELSIVTIWFALQYELLAAQGIESFCRHLEFAADLVEAHRRHQKAGGEATLLGHIGSRLLAWLGAYDSRASRIGGTGRLLQNLEAFAADYDFIDAAYPNLPTNTEDLKPILRLSLELDYMESRIVQSYRRSATASAAIWANMQSGLIMIHERFEADPSVAPIIASLTNPSRAVTSRITTRRFNCLLLLATFYSVVISFHRLIPAHLTTSIPDKLISAQVAATNIIRLASWVARFRPPSPQNIWPRILFLAGIETMDLAHQDFVVKTLTDAEVWGANFQKTRMLLEKVIKIQCAEGVRIDYIDVMKQDKGLFII
ncbi:uncharacterized protein GGS22DRAFT_69431 [Annulohypoxylon maeteangense]|uniref:uncharacterized protein n=1 Tax=Annulohypoxylon maeteangense TaxID=1927788 RepID=UPI0020073966|nr:uncharacterized protein GGS22DRAFT_69431 [Annulohypoxylon maeteangense]KAI0889273.1 hypothetical protein GGS22DRAFT_69431 [Annulohypoxylon maeteangense]